MIKIGITHFKEDGLLDYQYLYGDNIKKALEDMQKIKDTENYIVSIYNDEECTEHKATHYKVKYFIKLYGD